MKKSAVIFDFDGTIADTFPQFIIAVNQTLEKKGHTPITNHEPIREIRSKEGLHKLGIKWYRRPFFFRHVKKIFAEWTSHAKVHRGMKKALRKLSKKHSVIIVTSNGTKAVQDFVTSHKLAVDEVKGDLGLFSKGRVLKRLAKKHHVIAYVGDEARDIDAARKAKVKAIAVTWGFNSRAALKRHSPDQIITSAEQLEKL